MDKRAGQRIPGLSFIARSRDGVFADINFLFSDMVFLCDESFPSGEPGKVSGRKYRFTEGFSMIPRVVFEFKLAVAGHRKIPRFINVSHPSFAHQPNHLCPVNCFSTSA